jgi:hypothetical protein
MARARPRGVCGTDAAQIACSVHGSATRLTPRRASGRHGLRSSPLSTPMGTTVLSTHTQRALPRRGNERVSVEADRSQGIVRDGRAGECCRAGPGTDGHPLTLRPGYDAVAGDGGGRRRQRAGSHLVPASVRITWFKPSACNCEALSQLSIVAGTSVNAQPIVKRAAAERLAS